jgi:ParB-like chromosome segregation protein Spo0J
MNLNCLVEAADWVKLSEIKPPTHGYSTRNVDSILTSIKTVGMMNPIIINRNTKVVVDGASRREALNKGFNGETLIPVDYTESDNGLLITATSNLVRSAMMPSETASIVTRLSESNMTYQAIGEALNLSRQQVSKYAQVSKLPKEKIKLLDSGVVGLEAAVVCLKAPEETQEYLWNKAKEGLSDKKLRALIKPKEPKVMETDLPNQDKTKSKIPVAKKGSKVMKIGDGVSVTVYTDGGIELMVELFYDELEGNSFLGTIYERLENCSIKTNDMVTSQLAKYGVT